MNNEAQKVLSKDESKKLLHALIDNGCLRTIELRRAGIRWCTIAECWDELAYEKYNEKIRRDGILPAILIKKNMRNLINYAAKEKIEKSIDNRNGNKF